MIGKRLLIFVAFALTSIIFAGTAGAATLTVDDSGGADYMRIQDAINNASAGDTVIVYSGTYYENVNVSKQLVLRGVDSGAGMPVIDAGGSGTGVVLSVNGITLDSFIVQNGFYGVSLSNSNSNTLSNNTAYSNSLHGIYLLYSNNNTLSNNTAYSNKAGGIVLWTGSDNNTLINNNAINNLWGIYLLGSSNNVLISNIANENKGTDSRAGGFRVQSSSNNNKFLNNTANFNSATGFRIRFDANNNTILGNTIISNVISGISVDNSNYNIINSNIVSLNTIGIRLTDSWDWMSSGSHNNIVYNNFFNNTNNVYISLTSTNNTWNITKTTGANIVGGPHLGGNFWAHPNGTGYSQTCTDANRDGICDSPYTIDGNNTDYLPLSMNFTVTYNFLGILPPIRADGSSIFKLGSTVPVKFRITDANGNYVSTATANLTYQLITNEIPGTVEKPISSGAANEGNTFRYDSTDSLYIFNLGTKGMNTGTYQLNINLDDGTVHTVRISLR